MKRILLMIQVLFSVLFVKAQTIDVECDVKDSITIVADTISVFSGKTVSDEKKIVAEESLQMDNTTVITGGNLQATANDAITVLDETMVALGGELQLNGAGQYAVRFTYDASGNRIKRGKDETVK